MEDEIHIILAKANWCGHCKNFEPIYTMAEKIYKDNKFLKNYNIEFEQYDMADDDGKNKFMLNHLNAIDKIKGYPTVMINIRNLSDKKNEYHEISHSERDFNKRDEQEQILSGSNNFLTNIENLLKSLESDGKVQYVQAGGSGSNSGYTNNTVSHSTLENEMYRKKYLKYKSKYIELKNTYN